jgi:hypothetical protein
MSPRRDGRRPAADVDEDESDGERATSDRSVRPSPSDFGHHDEARPTAVAAYSSATRGGSGPSRQAAPTRMPSVVRPPVDQEGALDDSILAIMRASPNDGFDIPKLQGQAGFDNWQRDLFVWFRMFGCADIATGDERLDDCQTDRERRFWCARRNKGMGKLVFSMSREVCAKFDEYIRANDLPGFWRELQNAYAQRQPMNPVTILSELFTRKLRSDETVVDYIKDLERLQLELKKTLSDLGDDWMTRIMLTNVIEVFPDIGHEHTQKSAQGAPLMAFTAAKNLLLSRDDLDTRSGQRPAVLIARRNHHNRDSNRVLAVLPDRERSANSHGRARDRAHQQDSRPRDQARPYQNRQGQQHDSNKHRDTRPRCRKCNKRGHKAYQCKSPSDDDNQEKKRVVIRAESVDHPNS